MSNKYTITDTKTLEHSAVAMDVVVSWDELEKYYHRRLDKIASNIEIDGFRKGKAPHKAVEEQVGQMEILGQASQDVLGDIYPAMVLEQELKIMGYPQINITKMAYGSDLECTITTAVMPEVKLPDYKEIAKQHNQEEINVEVTDEEFAESVDRIRTMYAHSAEGAQMEGKGDPDAEHDLPELTDEFVSKLGDFSTVEEFNTKFREDMLAQKRNNEVAKRRETIITEITKESEFEIPEVLVESEKDKMMAAIKDDIARMGLEYSAWLEHSGKTETDMRSEMHDDAVARARADVVLKTIANKESITPDQEQVASQLSAIQEVHKDIPEENIRSYLENIYLNEATLKFLEEQK